MTGHLWVVLLALGAAFCYAVGVVLQQRAVAALAGSMNATGGRAHPSLATLLHSRKWVVGVAADGCGFGLEFLALRGGSVTLVQPLLVTGLLFALTVGALAARTRLRTSELGAGTLVMVGLAAFVLAARPSDGHHSPDFSTWMASIAVTVLPAAALCVIASRRSPSGAAACFAVAAGLVNGLFAGLAKWVGVQLGHGWLSVATSWQTWALVGFGALSLTLAARAFQAGAPTTAVTALFASEPLAGVGVGALLFGESIRLSPLAVVVEVFGVAGCLLGVALVARSPVIVATYAAPVTDPRAAECSAAHDRTEQNQLRSPAPPRSTCPHGEAAGDLADCCHRVCRSLVRRSRHWIVTVTHRVRRPGDTDRYPRRCLEKANTR